MRTHAPPNRVLATRLLLAGEVESCFRVVVELCKACILVSSYLIFCFSMHMTGETAFPGVSSTPVLTAGTVYFIDGTLVERDVKFARLSKGLD